MGALQALALGSGLGFDRLKSLMSLIHLERFSCCRDGRNLFIGSNTLLVLRMNTGDTASSIISEWAFGLLVMFIDGLMVHVPYFSNHGLF